MVFYIERMGWDGWLAYDVSTRNGDPVEMMSATISIVEAAAELVDKIGAERLQGYIDEGLPARAFEGVVRSLL
jgi:xylose isomerase